ncbi:hypothetical protein C8E01_102430 [Pontibacter virosus]|uniref:Uncharacterized protein n=1 Tax=Pontibacter virosus TaxID=1765052 RepID=A0A2U1B3S6_9BACT|nr:hypothetical protein C8E01_102430 [Pontibacter virosus]
MAMEMNGSKPISYYVKYFLILVTTHPNRVGYELHKLKRDYE